MSILLLLLAANTFTDGVVRDRADLVEVNHYFDESWNLTFDQVIWWEWRGDEYRVVDWRILKEVRRQSGPRPAAQIGPPEFVGGHATPIYSHRKRLWCSRWYDEKYKVQREVLATGCRETWTQYDPELQDREDFPSVLRRGLTER